MACAGNGVQPLPSDPALFPFTYTLAKEGKQIWHIVTYNGSGCRSDVVWMLFRMSFRSCGISKRQVYCQNAAL